MSEAPLYFQTITELADRIQKKQISPVEVTTALLDRIEDLDGRLKSYATIMADHAMAAARRAEKEIAAGTYRGSLPENRDPKFQRFTAPFDYSGAPTLSVPCGLNSEGLPLSLQFVGKPLSEPLLCQVGHAYECATEWHSMHPDV